MKAPMRRLQFIIIVAGLIALPVPAAFASVSVDIQITGLDFTYDESQDGSLFDANSILGRTGNSADATRATRAYFYLGGEKAGSSIAKVYVDFLMRGIHNIPKDGGIATTTSTGQQLFGFDLYDQYFNCILSLNLDTVTASYTRDASGPVLQFSFSSGGPSVGVVSQNLPYGLFLDEGQLISVRVSSEGGSVKDIAYDGNYLSSFNTLGGTGAVYGFQVPEPASFAALLIIGLLGLEIGRRIKSRANRNLTRT
ncbi:MAG: hypothetical protein GX594_07820 [Pirellulaceae bacterium]|nr:hypothetical protein [Pirellulaceae bacterium]